MDAAEVEQDVQLQRTSPELLADFQQSLKPFLWKTTKSGKTQIRRRVRTREADRLVYLVHHSLLPSPAMLTSPASLSRSKNYPNSSILTSTTSSPPSRMPSSHTFEHLQSKTPYLIHNY
jgi:hypothetical protein